MRTKSLGVLFCIAAMNVAVVYGCSSEDAATTPTDEEAGTTGKEAGPGSITTDASDSKDAGKDAKADAKKDAAKDTATADVAPDVAPIVYDPPYSPCDPLKDYGFGSGGIQRAACGLCGDPTTSTGKSRVCLKTPDSGVPLPDGGTPFPNPNNLTGFWSDWSSCTNGPGAVCDPAVTYPDDVCGNCGTQPRICTGSCTWVVGLTCNNQGPCKAGDLDWEGLGCPAGLGRTKTCNAQCSFDTALTCTPPPPNPNKITVNSTTVGATFTGQFTFDATKKQKKIDVAALFSGLGTCPVALDTDVATYQYVEVKNATASAIKVSLYTSAGTAPVASADTIMTVYAGAQVPKTDAEREACLNYYDDACDSTIATTDAGPAFNPKPCVSNAAGLLKGEELPGGAGNFAGTPIAAGASVTVYIAPYTTSTSPGTGVGNVKLNVRVEN